MAVIRSCRTKRGYQQETFEINKLNDFTLCFSQLTVKTVLLRNEAKFRRCLYAKNV